MSDYVAVCDAIIDRLLDIEGLADAKVYRYAPWTPEELAPYTGRCLAVWPRSEMVENVEPFTFDHPLARQEYAVLVWESASEGERQTTDENATVEFLDLANEVRNALITKETLDLDYVMDFTYSGSRITGKAGQIRWLEAEVVASVVLDFDNGA